MRACAVDVFPSLLRRVLSSDVSCSARTTRICLRQVTKPSTTSFSTTAVSAGRTLLPRSPAPGRRGIHAGVVDVDSRGLLRLSPCACRKLLPGWRSLSSRVMGNSAAKLSTIQKGRECNCWKCKSSICSRAFFCSCGAPQPLGEGRVDYFEMFDLNPSVFLDVKELEKKFKNMQKAFHPDLFANKSAEEQSISAANSSLANKTYQTLSQPMRRVKYLMRVLGSSALEDEGAAEDGPPVPPAFLMEVMETREQLEHCSSTEEAEAVLKQTRAAADQCMKAMDVALKAGGGKDELADAAIRLRYLYRIEDEARNVMHRLEDAYAKSSTVDGG